MKKFLILHYGFEPPTPEIMAEWNAWFEKVADIVVEKGHLPAGSDISPSGITQLPMASDSITGYTMITAEDLAQATEIAAACPFILGTRVYEIMAG